MVYYTERKSTVYLETTIVSYLAAHPSRDIAVASLWYNLMQELKVKEKDAEYYTDPILEECYRMKEEFNAQFNSLEELSAHLREVQEECRRKGMKVVSYYVPPSERKKSLTSTDDKTLDKASQ